MKSNIFLIFIILFFSYHNNVQSLEIEFENILLKIFPNADKFELIDENDNFIAYQDENIIGYIFKGNNKGFQSRVITFTGIDINGVCSSMEVIEHGETPPFFELLIENNFFSIFKDIDVNRIDIENKDFSEYSVDVISGATYSSNAVIENFWEAANNYYKIID